MPELPDAAGYRRLLSRSLHRIEYVELFDREVLRHADREALDACRPPGRAGCRASRQVAGGSCRARRPRDPPRDDRIAGADRSARGPRPLRPGRAPRRRRHPPTRSTSARRTVARRRYRRCRHHHRTTRSRRRPHHAGPVAGLPGASSYGTQDRPHRPSGHRRPREHVERRGAVGGETSPAETPADALSKEQVTRLHTARRDVVQRAARAGAIPRTPSWLTSQRGVPTPTCPRCHRPLRRSKCLAARRCGAVGVSRTRPQHTPRTPYR